VGKSRIVLTDDNVLYERLHLLRIQGRLSSGKIDPPLR
jgi:hypothetical protein